ncbi:MAG: hypothetical protein ACPGJV_12440 [Bacteriovoracaceae bacterium]
MMEKWNNVVDLNDWKAKKVQSEMYVAYEQMSSEDLLAISDDLFLEIQKSPLKHELIEFAQFLIETLLKRIGSNSDALLDQLRTDSDETFKKYEALQGHF